MLKKYYQKIKTMSDQKANRAKPCFGLTLKIMKIFPLSISTEKEREKNQRK